MACSSGDNSAVSVTVKPVFGIMLAAVCCTTGVGCLGNGGVFICGVVLNEAKPTLFGSIIGKLLLL